MTDRLTYEEAVQIWENFQAHTDTSDPDIAGLYQDFYKRAVRYAQIRAGWLQLTREEKQEADSGRTNAHNAFINSVHILARLQGESRNQMAEPTGRQPKADWRLCLLHSSVPGTYGPVSFSWTHLAKSTKLPSPFLSQKLSQHLTGP